MRIPSALILICVGALFAPAAAADEPCATLGLPDDACDRPDTTPLSETLSDSTTEAKTMANATLDYVAGASNTLVDAATDAIDRTPQSLGLPTNQTSGFLAATGAFTSAGIGHATLILSHALDGANETSDGLLRFIDARGERFALDLDTDDGRAGTCLFDQCLAVGTEGPLYLSLETALTGPLLIDTSCSLTDTDCDGETTASELRNGRNPFKTGP